MELTVEVIADSGGKFQQDGGGGVESKIDEVVSVT